MTVICICLDADIFISSVLTMLLALLKLQFAKIRDMELHLTQ